MNTDPATYVNHDAQPADQIASEDLIEEVSIDGMCGVY